jgi:membrane protein DedA with SNARE-associated domain
MDILQLLLDNFTHYGYFAVFFVLLLCGFGLPIPEDITLVAGGIIAGLEDNINVHMMLFVSMAGVLIGDSTMFVLGRIYGEKILQNKWISRWLTQKRYEKVQYHFDKYGEYVLFVARFLPGLRSPIFMTAGATDKIPFWKFLMFDGLAALISVPVWVYLGYFGANNRDWLMTWVHRGQTSILIAIGALLLLIVAFLLLKKKSNKEKIIDGASKS